MTLARLVIVPLSQWTLWLLVFPVLCLKAEYCSLKDSSHKSYAELTSDLKKSKASASAGDAGACCRWLRSEHLAHVKSWIISGAKWLVKSYSKGIAWFEGCGSVNDRP